MNIAIVLSGNGVYDGAEIQESTMLMLAIINNGMNYTVFAPNTNQHHVVNHLTGEVMDETRNVLVESARIARGNIQDIREYDPTQFDALIFPGGFGVAKNLSNYAFTGEQMEVNEDVAHAIKATQNIRKPLGFLCIAPILAAKVIANKVKITIGDDPTTASHINNLGAQHIEKNATEVAIDNENLVFTTPCYMTAQNIGQIYEGCNSLIKAMFDNRK